MQDVIGDGAYFASGSFVCQRALVTKEAGFETEVWPLRTVCEVAHSVLDRQATAQQIANAMNAQLNGGNPA